MSRRVFIYVFADPFGFRKIGMAGDPEQRLRTVQTGSPHPLTFEMHAECDRAPDIAPARPMLATWLAQRTAAIADA